MTEGCDRCLSKTHTTEEHDENTADEQMDAREILNGTYE